MRENWIMGSIGILAFAGAALTGCGEKKTEEKPVASPSAELALQEPPRCNGRMASVYVVGGVIVGGPDNGKPYTGILRGTPGNDVLHGTPGNDTIIGLGGNDTICGGPGNDTIQAGAGNDVIEGGPGDDLIDGGPGRDSIEGGPGDDQITGSN